MNHYMEALSSGTVSGKISLAMLGVLVALIAGCMALGYLHGVVRKTIRLVSTGLSALIAYFACRSIYGTLLGFCEGKTFAELFSFFGLSAAYEGLPPTAHDLLACFESDVASHLVSLPVAMIMIPLAFVGLFIMIDLILTCVGICVCGILGYTMNNNTTLTRWLGVAVGFFHGFAMAAFILVPVVGLLNFTGTVAQSTEDPESTVVQLYEEYCKDAYESPVNRTLTKLGMDKIYAKLCGVHLEADQPTVDSRIPAQKFIAIYTTIEGFGEADLAHLTPMQKAKLYNVINLVGDDHYLADIVSGLLRGFAHSDLVENKLLSDFEDPFRSILEEWVNLFATTDAETLKGDMLVILDVFFLLSDNGVIDAFDGGNDALIDALIAKNDEGKTVIRQVVDVFGRNPRTASFVTSLGRLGITLMQKNTDIGLTEDSLETFESLKEDVLNDVLSVREEDFAGDTVAYEAALSEALDVTLREHEIEADQQVLDSMASYIAEHHSEIEEFNDMSLNDIILSYFDAYIAATNP